MSNAATKTNQTAATAVQGVVMPGPSNAVTSRYKWSNIHWMKGAPQQVVLRAAVDWYRFQSAENAHSLYLAVMAMMGEEPENIHLLDGES